MLIHATVTISGEHAALIACQARLRRLLSAQFLRNEVAEHHGNAALCYDLKVEGGIPFPVFAAASQEFPELQFVAEWVNVAAGEKGKAAIVSGRVTAQEGERFEPRTADEHPVYVEVGPGGRLRLALTVFRATREEWRGYAVTATRDALLRILRTAGEDAVELQSTEGAAEWSARWRGAAGTYEHGRIEPPAMMDGALFRELDRLARDFAEGWIWFASGTPEDIAVETERYARYGYPVSAANVRSSHLHRMRTEAPEGAALVRSTVSAEDLWIRDLVLATWAAAG